MRILGNLLWIIFGGGSAALAWFFFGVLACLSVVGLPWGRACFVMAGFVFSPFGYESVPRDIVYDKEDIGTGTLGAIGNALWFLFAGLWIALSHLATAFCLALTLIGIPFAVQHVKLAKLALFPIGKTVVPVDVAREVKLHHAARFNEEMREERRSLTKMLTVFLGILGTLLLVSRFFSPSANVVQL